MSSCAWCKATRVQMTPVGCIEQGTSAGTLIQACGRCMESRRLIPFAEHPDDTDGQPRHRPAPRKRNP